MTRFSRPVGFVAIAVLLALLAVQQVASMALLAPYASGRALPTLLPQSLGLTLYGILDRAPLPTLLGAPVRITLARRLLANGAVGAAASVVPRLPAGIDRADLEGIIAQDRGDFVLAANDFVEAGDDQRLMQIVDALEKTDVPGAIALQKRLVRRFDTTPIPAPGLADAFWRLGVLDATLGYVGKPAERAPANRASEAAYARAVAIAPFSAKYLLALANQQANMGDRSAADATFRRVLAVDPRDVDAAKGLERLGTAQPTP